jgi:hypothetical protein
VLHLPHDPLVLLVGLVGGLRHDAVEARSFEAREPVLCHVRVVGHRGEVHAPEIAAEHGLENPPSLGERLPGEVAVIEGQEVEGHEAGRRLLGQPADPRRSRVEALLKRIEAEPGIGDHHDLPVHDASLRQRDAQQLHELREVARERPVVPRPELELVAVAEHDAPEPVPLGLVEETVGSRHRVHRPGEHGLHRRHDGELHGWDRTNDQN